MRGVVNSKKSSYTLGFFRKNPKKSQKIPKNPKKSKKSKIQKIHKIPKIHFFRTLLHSKISKI
jgi:hypothetical protein